MDLRGLLLRVGEVKEGMEGDGKGGGGMGGKGREGTGGEGMEGKGTGGECCGVPKILKIDPELKSRHEHHRPQYLF